MSDRCKHGRLDEFGWCGKCHDEKVGENDAAIQAYEASISPQLGKFKVTPLQRRAFRAGYAAGKAERDELLAALRDCACPRPANDRPDDWTTGQCYDEKECGCKIGHTIAAAERLAGDKTE